MKKLIFRFKPKRLKGLAIGLASGLTAAALLIPAGTAHANNFIICGLNQGINIAVGNGSRNTTFTSCLNSKSQDTVQPQTRSDGQVTSPTQPPVPAPTTPLTTNPTRLAPTGTYAALGDSVAAGLGLPIASTSAEDQGCGRSTDSYPYLVAAKKGLMLQHLACSGAKVGDLVSKQDVNGSDIPSQLPAAFSAGKPTLITVTAGANDAHWTAFFNSCYFSDCSTSANTIVADTYLKILQLKLHYVLNDIRYRSNNQPPKVIFTGYYNPITSICTSQQNRITPAEINWIDGEVTAINETIRQVVQDYPFATFVPVSFQGHDVCSDNPWVQGPLDAAPFHPTATGQQVIADAVLAQLN